MARDPALRPQVVSVRRRVAGTAVEWDQPAKIMPFDPAVREAISAIEATFEERLAELEERVAHLPSRVRSLLWVACAIPVLLRYGQRVPDRDEAEAALRLRLPSPRSGGVGAREPDLAALAL